MTVAKSDDGSLVIHNAVALDDAAMKELERWGTPAVMFVPSAWHRLDAASYKKRYPQLRVFCPAGATKRVAKLVEVDGTYADYTPSKSVRLEHLDGTKQGEGVMTVTDADEVSLVFNDAIFNQAHGRGFGGFVMKLLGSTGGLKTTPIFRLTGLKNKRALADHFRRLAQLEGLERIIIMHGANLENDVSKKLMAVAEALAPAA